jgi:hypothetical protein
MIMNSTTRMVLAAAPIVLAVPLGLSMLSNIEPNRKAAWGENIGWTIWRHDAPDLDSGAHVTPTHLSGMLWGENVGWISLGGGGPYENDPLDSSTYGVNVDPESGDLFGKAWGENIGWVNFDTRATQGPQGQQARLDFCENRFQGYVWGENIGWIQLGEGNNFVALGPDCPAGDVACDGVIALLDYSWFVQSVSGPGVEGDCLLFDFDGDDDVDLSDFRAFQVAFSGQ